MKNYQLPRLLHGADYNYEQWLEYPDVLDEDFRLFEKAGINALSIGIFAWSRLEPSEGEYTFGLAGRTHGPTRGAQYPRHLSDAERGASGLVV